MRFRIGLIALAASALALGYFARTPDTGGVALRDFEAYYSAGSTWRYHGDPYSRDVWRAERVIPGVVATRDELLPFVSPPFGLPLWGALSRLPWSAAAAVWKLVLGLAFAVVVLGAVRLATGRVAAVDALAALIAAATFGPLTSGVALGQVAVVSCAAIVATPLLLEIRFAFAAGAGALIAALQPNLALVLVARLSGRRAWIAFLGALTLAIGGSLVAVAGIGGAQQYLSVLRDHAAAERGIAIQTTLGAVAIGFGANAGLATSLALVAAGSVVAVLAVQILSRRYTANDSLVLACAAAPLAIPFSHEHDFNVVFLPALVLARRAHGGTWYVAAAAAVAVAVDWLGIVQRPGDTLEAASFAFGTAAALLAFASRRSHAALLFPCIAAAIVALVSALARGHVLPTWPDALPQSFHVQRLASAAAVWAAEQRASGIARLDPAWAALRLMPLAGCAVLWAVGSAVLSASRRSEPHATSARLPAEVYPSA